MLVPVLLYHTSLCDLGKVIDLSELSVPIYQMGITR